MVKAPAIPSHPIGLSCMLICFSITATHGKKADPLKYILDSKKILYLVFTRFGKWTIENCHRILKQMTGE